ncbi:MAG: hypothetical protein V3T84_07125 [Phycisphaerales bacterium]
MNRSRAHVRSRCPRRAFTLLEALMAAGILFAVVVGVTSAVTAGQLHAFEARQRIAASLAAEELIGRIITDDYGDLPTWNGFNEPVGTLTDGADNPMPRTFDAIGREVEVVSRMETINDLGIAVRGRQVVVRAFNENGRTLAEITYFIAEPAP